MKEVKAWQCGFCNRVIVNKGNCGRHESRCKNNPAKRHCITCTHGIKRSTMVDVGAGCEPIEVLSPYCDERKMFIHDKPYNVECEIDEIGWRMNDIAAGLRASGISVVGNWNEDDVRPIPYTCLSYEYKGFAGWGEPVREQESETC